MRYVRFGRTNVEVPAVSLGTWGHGGPRLAGQTSVGWSGHDDKAAVEALVLAYERGITHWDTADVYGDGQAEVLIGGVWGRVPREKIFVATKVGWDAGGYGHWYHPSMMRKHLERSLRNLAVDVIDLYYLHHSDFGPGSEYLDDAIDFVRKAREEGKIRFIGLSDWNADKIMAVVERVDPDVVQPYRNVVDDQFVSSGLRDWVKEHDLGVAFFSPLKHGLLLGKYERPQHFPEGDFRRTIPEFSDPEAIARMQRAAAAVREQYPGKSEPVLHALLGAILSDAPTGCVLVGQRNPRQVEAAAAAGEALAEVEADWVRSQYAGEAP